MRTWTALMLGLLIGCGDSGKKRDAGSEDAAPDAGDGGQGFEPAPPEAPRMTPCPKGWREVADADDPDLVTCDPWPEDGAQDCPEDEAHFPGEPGCRLIGTACPEGDWAEDIPRDRTVIYVLAGAAEGGDGTQDDPFATIGDALRVAGDRTVVALSKGTFDEGVTLRRPLTLWGACVADTIVAPSTPSTSAAISVTTRAGAVVKNLQVSGARHGVDVLMNTERAELDSVLVRAATTIGVYVRERGNLLARDLVVRDTQAGDDGNFGQGLDVASSARMELQRGAIEGNRGAGIVVFDADTELVATDVVVRDTLSRPSDSAAGAGLDLYGGSRAVLERVVLEGNRSRGSDVLDPGTELVATDFVIRGTQPRESDADFGYGLGVTDGARAELTRTLVEHNRVVGIRTFADAPELVATDLVIRDTGARESNDAGGVGIQINEGAQGTLERVAVVRNRGVGIIVGETGTQLHATDVAIRDTREQLSDRDNGHGLALLGGAQVELSRVAIDGSRGTGVIAFDFGTRATFEDLVVEATLEQACAKDGCLGLGSGIVALGGAAIEATHFRSSDNVLCGLQLARGGTIDLHEGEVSRNAIGVNVQTADFDVDRIGDRVLFVDNERNLDSTALPVPLPVEGLFR